jgi:transcriptional regulator with XRE-family HTH domain
MEKTFGQTLKGLRESAQVGLNQLANYIETSRGYLSDVENEKVAPPSVDKIEAISRALKCDVWTLLKAAGKEIEYITRQPAAADFLRKTEGYTDEDWEKAGKLVDIAGLGKGGEKNK